MNPILSHPYALPLWLGALILLPFELPKWVCHQAHHLLRAYGLP